MTPPPHLWIDPDDSEQVNWIEDYLERHNVGIPRSYAYRTSHTSAKAHELIATFQARLDDRNFSERYEKMQVAWRKEKSRRRADKKSASYQLSSKALELLGKLARKRTTTKAGVLEQIIHDAWHEHDRGAKQLKKTKATYKSRLKDQSTKHQQAQQISRQAIEALLKALSLELHQRCRLEALVGKDDGLPLEGTSIGDYSALVSKRVMELEVALQDMNLARLSSATLRARMQALAERDGLERTTDDMQ